MVLSDCSVVVSLTSSRFVARGCIQIYPNLIDIFSRRSNRFLFNARLHLSIVANPFKCTDFNQIANIYQCVCLSGLELFKNLAVHQYLVLRFDDY